MNNRRPMTTTERKVSDAIDNNGLPMSMSSLRYRTRLSTTELRKALRGLKLLGIVEEIQGRYGFAYNE